MWTTPWKDPHPTEIVAHGVSQSPKCLPFLPEKLLVLFRFQAQAGTEPVP